MKKIDEKYLFRFLPAFVLFILFFASCSSSPKRPAQIVTAHNTTVKQLALANTETERGNYTLAKSLMDESWRLAVSIDAPEMRILVQLSMGNLAFYKNDRETAEKCWQTALDESIQNGDRELTALAEIYKARGTLSYGTPETAQERAKQVITAVTGQMDALKKSNQLYTAYAWNLIGFAYKELGAWSEAETALEKSAAIHEGLLYLELTAYDWYAIASVRSVSGNADSAIEAMQNAIAFDRRAENSYGLGMDYMALGDICAKSSRHEDAKKSYQRSADIFTAASMPGYAQLAQKKLSAQ